MARNKLTRLLSVLHGPEHQELSKFLAASLQAPNHECCLLYKLLLKQPQDGDFKTLKPLLFKKIYKGADYDDTKMRKLMTRLTRLIERFLVLKELDRSPDLATHLLARSLETRNDFGLFCDYVHERIETLDLQPYRGTKYFKEMSELYHLVFLHQESAKLGKTNEYFQQYVSNFDLYYIVATLQNGTDTLIRKRLNQDVPTLWLIEGVEQAGSNQEVNRQPAVKLFHELYRLHAALGESVDLEALKDTVNQGLPILEEYGQRMALKTAIGYGIRWSNVGSAPHRRFVFEMYKTGIEMGLLVHGENGIASSLFLNILTAALAEGETDWARRFLMANGRLIQEDERENTCHYGEALCSYYEGVAAKDVDKLERAMTETMRVPLRLGLNMDLRVRLLQVRILFELFELGKEELEDLLTHVRNFIRYLKASQQFSGEFLQTYLDSLALVKKLAKLIGNPNSSKEDYQALQQSLVSGNPILLKNWLLEKMAGRV